MLREGRLAVAVERVINAGLGNRAASRCVCSAISEGYSPNGMGESFQLGTNTDNGEYPSFV